MQVVGVGPSRKRYKTRDITPWQERFWRYVKPGPPGECWEWTGSRNEHGYGRLQRGSRGEGQIKAHRASFEIHNGTIPDGLHVCHRCDNPPCVNPAHLFLGTMTENLRDAATKGRTGPQRGTSGKRKLSDQDVRDLREMAAAGVPYAEVARLVGVTPAHVSAVALGRARSDVGGPITQRYPRRSAR